MAMYYSRHDDDVHFSEFNPGPYTLYGHNIFVGKSWDCKRRISVCVEDIASSGLKPEEYFTLVITEGINGVKPGFIESFPNLQDLIIEANFRKIECTPALEALLQLAGGKTGEETGAAIHPQEHLPGRLPQHGAL